MITATTDTFRLAQAFTVSRGSRTEARDVTAHITRNGITRPGACVPYACYGETVGCMFGPSLAVAPETLLAQGAVHVDLDAPLLLAEDRPHPMFFDTLGVHAPSRDLWG